MLHFDFFLAYCCHFLSHYMLTNKVTLTFVDFSEPKDIVLTKSRSNIDRSWPIIDYPIRSVDRYRLATSHFLNSVRLGRQWTEK
uniref:RRM domain-containing protein n=1 Tax=Parascaris univalens TaxID=6257 RepID=A0A914ZWB1_PARUN